MANNKLIIEVTADTTEALEEIKEVTEAANECADALERFEKVIAKFTIPNETVELFCDGRVIAKTIVTNKE
ncbi:hypothetical protein [Bacillus cereus]|uniref:hypothetical protein n=1 Tax=Bacillus cereus TaxID=1396 RepID=UPI000BEBF598|nr:hypothetical protein [Bacillus cereus]PDY19555.1 hypothetical protein COM76_09425 [Bacillus cereus]